MKKRLLTVAKIVLILLFLFFLIPMPHGGTLGSNFTESIVYEVKKYFSLEAKETQAKEKEEWRLQKEEAKKSWEKFEQENPQYFPK